jgi:hypothetical protein
MTGEQMVQHVASILASRREAYGDPAVLLVRPFVHRGGLRGAASAAR